MSFCCASLELPGFGPVAVRQSEQFAGVAGAWCCNVYGIHGFTAVTVQRWIARIWCCTCNCAFLRFPVWCCNRMFLGCMGSVLYLCDSGMSEIGAVTARVWVLGFGSETVGIWDSRVYSCNCASLDFSGLQL